MAKTKKIIIAAGGTGGHLYPGLVLGKELKARNFEPIFIIRKNDPAKNILIKENFLYFEIPVKSLPRKLSPKLITFPFFLFKSLIKTKKLLNNIDPIAAVGMGGYISFPVVLSAYLKKIPTLIHEQNYIPGFSNRLLSLFSNKIAVSFENSIKHFNKKRTHYTGNPIRPEIFNINPDTAYKNLNLNPNKFTVFVFGGSLGASKINKTMVLALNLLESYKDKIQFIHLTGKNEFEYVKKQYNEHGFTASVYDYFHDIGQAYTVADIVICRAGASTVAELKALNKKAILIPYPYATGNHQTFNALELAKTSTPVPTSLLRKAKQWGADVIKDKELNSKLLYDKIVNQYNNYSKIVAQTPAPDVLPQKLLADLVLGLL